jgi:hypothetical protein
MKTDNNRQVSPSRGKRAICGFSALATAACLLFAGCGRDHAWIAAGSRGIESLGCDGRVFLVLLNNGSWESSTFASKPVGPSCSSHGSWREGGGGREIAWSCRTKDGTNGTVTVDSQSFDLSKGGLFLVSTNGSQTKVEQLDVDVSKFRDGPAWEHSRALVEAEPRVAEFLKGFPARH